MGEDGLWFPCWWFIKGGEDKKEKMAMKKWEKDVYISNCNSSLVRLL